MKGIITKEDLPSDFDWDVLYRVSGQISREKRYYEPMVTFFDSPQDMQSAIIEFVLTKGRRMIKYCNEENEAGLAYSIRLASKEWLSMKVYSHVDLSYRNETFFNDNIVGNNLEYRYDKKGNVSYLIKKAFEDMANNTDSNNSAIIIDYINNNACKATKKIANLIYGEGKTRKEASEITGIKLSSVNVFDNRLINNVDNYLLINIRE